MNLGDKTRSVTIRLTPDQYAFLKKSADSLEVSPSRFLRMVINATMSSAPTIEATAVKVVNEIEHTKTDINHIV